MAVHFGDLLVLGVDDSDNIVECDVDLCNHGTEITPTNMDKMLEEDFDPDYNEMVIVVRVERIYTKSRSPFALTEGKGMGDN
jgi:hypothetical protein